MDWVMTLQERLGRRGGGSGVIPQLLVTCTGTQLSRRSGNATKDQQEPKGFIITSSSPEHHKLKKLIRGDHSLVTDSKIPFDHSFFFFPASGLHCGSFILGRSSECRAVVCPARPWQQLLGP